jgi:hypothetical protein
MARKPNPENIYLARRAAIASRLWSEGVDEVTGGQWLAAWEAEAAFRGLERHSTELWDECDRWIAEQRSARNRRGAVP